MDIYEDAIVPETPKAVPNEQMFIYVPIAGAVSPGIASFDSTDFKVETNGRVYMKVSPVNLARSIDGLDRRLSDLEKISDEVGFVAVKIPASEWSDELPTRANITFAAPSVASANKSYMALLIPADNETRAVSTAADIYIDNTILSEDLNMNISVICKESVPSIDLNYVAIIFVEENRAKSSAGAAAFVSIGAGGSSRTETYIGETQPEKDRYNLWVDTSSEPPLMKYKDVSGNWVTVAGAGAGSHPSVLTVTNKSGWISKKIGKGGSCRIDLAWSSTENGAPTGNGILKIDINGYTKVNKEVVQGPISEDVGKYLTSTNNKIVATIYDVYGNNRSIELSVITVSVSIDSTFSDASPFTGEIKYFYTPVGDAEKTVYFIVDGDPDGDKSGTDIITESNIRQYHTIPALTHGSHTLEVYLVADIEGEPVPSNRLYYDLICTEEGNNTPIITTTFRDKTAKQYGTVNINYIAYTPNSLTSEVQLVDGDNILTRTVDRTRQSWPYKATEAGMKNLSIVCGDTVKPISFEVIKSDVIVEAEAKELELYLTSVGRANTDSNPSEWKFKDVKAQMTGFNFTSDGWLQDDKGNTVLRVAGDARVYIPFNIFETDFKNMGKTIEFEFATRDVMNYDAEIIKCWAQDRGVLITAQKALFKSELSKVFTQYKENEQVRITFCIEQKAENRLLAIYINGIMSGVVQYDSDDSFKQTPAVGISIGSNDCTTDIYNIRIYNSNLNQYQILRNWEADTQDVDLLTERYIRNDIFDAYGNIEITKLPKYTPYFVVNANAYEDLPDEEIDAPIVSGRYVDPNHPERSFTFENATMVIQGTSSLTYPRKNYKVYFNGGFDINGKNQEKYQLRPTSMPTNIFTFKADQASSEGANNVELVMLYEDTCPVKTPPQLTDDRVRQGIEGYPILMFYYDGDNYHFVGKYNFNNDKETAEVFGLSEGDESWEIRMNNVPMANWQDDDFSGDAWESVFKARYPKGSKDTTNLQDLSTWLKSTDTTAPTKEAIESVTYEYRLVPKADGGYEVQKKTITFTEDTAEYRLTKFRNEFADWFNVDATLFNYLFTDLFLMTDNRAKNAFPTRYAADEKWLILPYDYDTALGCDNEGDMVYGYHLEDIDMQGTKTVYNGQDSVLYVNIRLAFADELKAMYQDLRSHNKAFSYESVIERFDAHQLVWGEAVFNEDAKFKYIEPLTKHGDGNELKRLHGAKAEQRRWWLYNRFRYIDSKYEAGDSLTDFIKIRPYAVADITVTPYADIYAVIRFDEFVRKARALRENGPVTIQNPLSAGKEADILIYSASQLADIGDLSGLKPKEVGCSKAIRLSSLKIGSCTPGYDNPNLTSLTVGNLTLLKSIDLRGCSALTQPVDLSGCANIEHVYCEGTKITGVSLPNGGILKTLHLPATVNSLIIRNQPYLKDLVLPSYGNLTTLWLENPNTVFNVPRIVEQLKGSPRVRLIGIDCTFSDSNAALAMCDKLYYSCRGMDESGNNLDHAVLSGRIYMEKATQNDLNDIRRLYPDTKNFKVEYGQIMNAVTFIVGDKVLSTQFLNKGEAIVKPADPNGEVTPSVIRTFKGWSRDGVTLTEVPATMGDESLTFIALFDEQIVTYQVKFVNIDGTVLESKYCKYGETPAYAGATPVNPIDSDLAFLGWEPALTAVTGDAEYTAKYETMVATRALLMRNIYEYSSESVESVGNYAFYGCDYLSRINIPSVTSIGSSAFYECSALTSVSLPSATSIYNSAFASCKALTSVNLPSVTRIESNAFHSCKALTGVSLPATPPTLSSSAFGSVPTTCVFYIPRGSLAAYEDDTNWGALKASGYQFEEEDRE